MLIVIKSSAETHGSFIQSNQLMYIHACRDENFKWNEVDFSTQPADPEWSVEFVTKDCESITIRCASEEIARNAEKELPIKIYEAAFNGDKALLIELN